MGTLSHFSSYITHYLYKMGIISDAVAMTNDTMMVESTDKAFWFYWGAKLIYWGSTALFWCSARGATPFHCGSNLKILARHGMEACQNFRICGTSSDRPCVRPRGRC